MPATKQKTGFRGPSPDVGKATQWKPGQSGNPNGARKSDLAKKMFEELFEEEYVVVKRAVLGRLKKGDAKMFETGANRAFGKVPDTINVNYRDIGSEERIRELLAGADARRAALSKP